MTHSVPLVLRTQRLLEDGLALEDLKNLTIVHHFGNTSVRRKLESLPIEEFTSCMIFADQEFELDTMRSDSHSLASLLLIRDIQGRRKSESWKCDDQESGGEGKLKNSFLKGLSNSARSSAGKAAQFVTQETCPIICEVLDP